MPELLPPSDLAGKTFIITGASSGIGAATARALGRAGSHVVLAARREAPCRSLAQSIENSGGRAWVVPTDWTQELQVKRLVDQTVQHFGALHGAFNNAGYLGAGQALHEIDTSELRTNWSTNVDGVFWSMKYQIEAMLALGMSGSIVNTASIAAHIGFPHIAAYNASKHAVLGLTRTAAVEYFTKGIRVNAVSPGPTITDMALKGFGSEDAMNNMLAATPAGRAARVEDIVPPVLFLLSEGSRYINGQSLVVDGGYTAV